MGTNMADISMNIFLDTEEQIISAPFSPLNIVKHVRCWLADSQF
jgi:hypothetical protein